MCELHCTQDTLGQKVPGQHHTGGWRPSDCYRGRWQPFCSLVTYGLYSPWWAILRLLHQPLFFPPQVHLAQITIPEAPPMVIMSHPYSEMTQNTSVYCAVPARYRSASCFPACYLNECLQYTHDVLRDLGGCLGPTQITFHLRYSHSVYLRQPTHLSLFLISLGHVGQCPPYFRSLFSPCHNKSLLFST